MHGDTQQHRSSVQSTPAFRFNLRREFIDKMSISTNTISYNSHRLNLVCIVAVKHAAPTSMYGQSRLQMPIRTDVKYIHTCGGRYVLVRFALHDSVTTHISEWVSQPAPSAALWMCRRIYIVCPVTFGGNGCVRMRFHNFIGIVKFAYAKPNIFVVRQNRAQVMWSEWNRKK